MVIHWQAEVLNLFLSHKCIFYKKCRTLNNIQYDVTKLLTEVMLLKIIINNLHLAFFTNKKDKYELLAVLLYLLTNGDLRLSMILWGKWGSTWKGQNFGANYPLACCWLFCRYIPSTNLPALESYFSFSIADNYCNQELRVWTRLNLYITYSWGTPKQSSTIPI